ncbi:MAG: Lrp/AsnC family transcriptional regulator [Pseudomonadota bacterium]|jgi:Lrp/AsnC family transcriptional regulator for asnA, asnC and gidA
MAFEPADGSIVLDETDKRIVALLKAHGRETNRDIARALKISPTNVGARIRRMEDANALRVVAVTDFAALGYDVLIAVGIEVGGRAAEAVGLELAKLPAVFSVHLVTGARDLELLVAVKDFDELRHFLESEIVHIPGIRRISAGLAVDVVKYNFDRVPM